MKRLTILACVLCLPIIAWSIGSRLQGELQRDKAQTMSNAKQIATGMLMYASDYDDIFPYARDSKTAMLVTTPYVRNRDVFKTLNPAGGEFVFNLKLGGVSESSIPQQHQTPMYCESKAWPDGSRVVAFADSYVKSISAQDWPAIVKALAKSFKRTATKPFPANYAQTLAKQMGIKF